MRRLLLSFLLAFCAITLGIAQKAYTPQQVPNVHLQDANSYVSDPQHHLLAQEKADINRLAHEIEQRFSAEVAIVIIPSVKDDDPEGFSEELFRLWGLGKDKEDNGLLIVYAYEPEGRFIRFETGYGLEGVLPDALCYQIQQQEMIPMIKQGNTAGAFTNALQVIAEVLQNGYKKRDAHTPNIAPPTNGSEQWSVGELLIGYLALTIAVALFHMLTLGLQASRAPLQLYSLLYAKESYSLLGCLTHFFPLALILMLPYNGWLKRKLKRKVLDCPQCKLPGSVSVTQGEHARPYLTNAQALESSIGSRYFVHAHCTKCSYNKTEGVDTGNRYDYCPRCGTRAYSLDKKVAIGQGVLIKSYKCLYCGHSERHKEYQDNVSAPIIGGILGGLLGRGGSGGGFPGGGFSGGSWGGGSSGGGGSTSRF